MVADRPNRYAIAAHEFHRARRRAAVEELLARLRGQSAGLLSFDEVTAALGVRGQASAGIQHVPIAAIVGSVGRYNDFSRTFLPLQDSDQDRWVSVRTAAAHIGDLPPVELYRIDDVYFVLDGNHRVSIARQQDLEYIDAYVTEVQTRVPLPAGTDPDALIVAAEYTAFLAWSRLDQLRPGCDLRVSVPGQYPHLENHIEAFRFLAETREGQELDLASATTRWYDEAYAPLAQAIRLQGILNYFPGRTETDFFIWLAAHRVALEQELGVHVAPEVAASRLLDRLDLAAADPPRSLPRRIRRQFTRLVVPERTTPAVEASQAQARTLARYSDQLFKDILVPVDLAAPGRVAMRQALALAVEEDARLCVAGLGPDDPGPANTAAMERLAEDVRRTTSALELPVECTQEHAGLLHFSQELVPLYDLIVIDRAFGAASGEVPSPGLLSILRHGRRPVWIAGDLEDRPLSSRIVLLLNGSGVGREALFIAAYLAERWHVGLTVLILGHGRATDRAQRHAASYLEIHEITYEALAAPENISAGDLIRVIDDQQCDLLIAPGLSAGGHADYETTVAGLIRRWPHSLLLAAWA
jgi:hypothetical protein